MLRVFAKVQRISILGTVAASLVASLVAPSSAKAGKLSWLDDIVRQVVRETRAEGRAGARTLERSTGRLFVREADESLETLARRSDDLAKIAVRGEDATEALLESRFDRLIRREPEAARAFRALAPEEKRLVVAMGETAQSLARRFPERAETMIRALGVDGLTAVRAYGDDVAEVLVKEGPEGIGVLRKSGRPGWKFYTGQVLAHKKKLIAAGVLAVFLADPDKFVDSAGRATKYAVEQFAKAGVSLAGAVGTGAVSGVEATLGALLASHGLDSSLARKFAVAFAALVAVSAAMVLLGVPVRLLFLPLIFPLRLLFRRGKPRAILSRKEQIS